MLVILYGMFSSSMVLAQNSPQDKSAILILHSYHQGYEWTDSVHDAIVDSLQQSDFKLDLYIEYMDTIRQPQARHLELLVEVYMEKYAPEKVQFDVIIVTDDNALDFILEYRSTLFGVVPVVFCGANQLDPARIEGVTRITGVNEEQSVLETIQLALYLADNPEKAAVISGSGLAEQRNLAVFQKIAPFFKDQIEFVYLTEAEPEELAKQLEAFSADDLIFNLSYMATPSGRALSVKENIDLITSSTPAMIFALWDFMVVHGVLGGKVVHGHSQGQVAARMALQILGGKRAEDIPVMMESPNQYLLDGRVLDRHELSEKHLPVNAMVINRLPRYLIEDWDNLIRDSFFGYDLFENHGSVMLIVDPETGVILDANRRARMFYGYANLIGMNISEIKQLTLSEIEVEMAAAARLDRNYSNFRHLLADNTLRNVEVYAYPIRIQDRQVLFSIVIDATAKIQAQQALEQRNQFILVFLILAVLASLGYALFLLNSIRRRKKAEEALRQSENLLQKVFDTLPIGLWIADKNGTLLRGNSAGQKIWGQEPLVDQSRYGVFKARRLPSGEEIAPEDWGLAHTVNQGVSIVDELLEIDAFDGQQKIILNYTVPVLDRHGNVEAAVVMNQDITDRYRAEEEKQKLQDQLLQAQKLESVGRLAGGVAHDFNNKLQAILGYCEMAQSMAESNPELHKSLLEIHKAAEGSADLTRQLLAFARKQTASPQVLDLNATVSGMLRMLQRLIGENIALVWKAGANLWPVKIDPVQVDQILANLAINARDAMAETGHLTVATRNVTLDADACTGDAELQPGEYVLLQVSDTGCGISSEMLEHIFEPFFTTKEVGKGTGLGLATVYGVMKQNKGFVRVSSEPEEGTTFKLYLPRTMDDIRSSDAAATNMPAGGTETVLLVEDDATILKLGQAILQHFGYTVLSAGAPHAALEIAANHTGSIHLLVTDVVMPEMNGKTLRNKLAASGYPQMKVLYMSGYTADVIAEHGVLDAGVNFLQKPFAVNVLAAAVRKVLDD